MNSLFNLLKNNLVLKLGGIALYGYIGHSVFQGLSEEEELLGGSLPIMFVKCQLIMFIARFSQSLFWVCRFFEFRFLTILLILLIYCSRNEYQNLILDTQIYHSDSLWYLQYFDFVSNNYNFYCNSIFIFVVRIAQDDQRYGNLFI